MTTCVSYRERERLRRRRARAAAQRSRAIILSLACVLVLLLLCMYRTASKEPMQATTAPALTSEPAQTEAAETSEPVRWRDDIVSDGRLLSYDLQETMQAYCEEYGVPYALALAIAEVETHFDPDAVSRTGDYGLMQINAINHDWLREQGIDPLTYDGNIEGGVYIIAQHLQKYGDTEMAVMAYNCGPTGAKRLWDAGTYQTEYSRSVMAAFEHWTSVLEE